MLIVVLQCVEYNPYLDQRDMDEFILSLGVSGEYFILAFAWKLLYAYSLDLDQRPRSAASAFVSKLVSSRKWVKQAGYFVSILLFLLLSMAGVGL